MTGATTPEIKVVHFGTWGVDIGTRDLTVNPGDDFQRYAAGKWLDANEIPADKSQNGVGSELADRNQEQLRAIVMGSPKDSQIGDFYASYMGVVGLLVAMLINLFLQSPAMQLAISAIGVLLFAGLTAYDTQKIKSMSAAERGPATSAIAVAANRWTIFTSLSPESQGDNKQPGQMDR